MDAGGAAVIRVLIVDDHPVMRRGLKTILTDEIEGVSCSEAGNGAEAVAMVEHGDWSLVILDISMPGQSGIEAIKEILRLRPRLPVLVASVHSEEQYGKRALLAGASGYLTKESAPDELVRAVRQVLSGHPYVSQTMAESLATHMKRDSSQSPHERLSDRELEVLVRIGSGRTTSQIAEELHLSLPTVSTYRARILKKMGLHTTAELIYYTVRKGMTDDS
jgi:two-component system, NarL family, invasion response regulator UvrY